jgi:hypothetical protein
MKDAKVLKNLDDDFEGFWFIWMKNENVKVNFASRVNFAMQVNNTKIHYSPG